MTKEKLTQLMLLTGCLKEGLQNLNEPGMKQRLITTTDKVEAILMMEHENLKSEISY